MAPGFVAQHNGRFKSRQPAVRAAYPLEPDSKLYETLQYLARRRVVMRIWAMMIQAPALAMVVSQSLVKRRHRPSHVKVRSTLVFTMLPSSGAGMRVARLARAAGYGRWRHSGWAHAPRARAA
jgi:hypothetical protein